MGERPTGTVTFLFTDIEGSTLLWEQDRERMELALGEHDRVVRAAMGDADGYVFATGGDGFGVAFTRADAAVGAAVAVQRELRELSASLRLRVRMGVHTGEAQERDSNYFGPALNRAARIMSMAHGGEVLVSSTTAEIVADRIGAGVELGLRREVDLRGVTRPMVVYGLSIDGAMGRDPKSVPAVTAELPVPRTGLFGRTRELDAVLAGLATDRLVTIIGIGGVGKTRLAVEAAARAEGFAEGTRFVDLSGVRSAERVPEAAAGLLGVAVSPGVSPEDAIAGWLRHRSMLLVVDNCEHVLGGAGALVARILDGAPEVGVLATSREPLLVDGERLLPLGTLGIADELGEPGAGVELFVDRVRRVRPDLSDLASDPIVLELCERLDGIPLALELAAAKMRSLQPADMLRLLDERFRLLTGGRRGAVERHQTLRAAVAWSYELLDDRSRLVFDRLSVFSGRFDLNDALSIACDDGLGEFDVIESAGELADKSMLEVGDDPPYRLLETLAVYGREQLASRGELEEARRRHAVHFAGLAAKCRQHGLGSREAEFRGKVRSRAADFRGSVLWATESGELDTAAHILLDLARSGWILGWHEVYQWCSAFPEEAPLPSPSWWPEFLATRASAIGMADGYSPRVDAIARRAAELGPDVVHPRVVLAASAFLQGRIEDVDRYATEAADLALRNKDPLGQLSAGVYQVAGRIAVGRMADAERSARAMEDLAERTQSPSISGFSHLLIGRALLQADVDAAATHFERALQIGTQIDSPYVIVNAERDLAWLAHEHDPKKAAARYTRLLKMLLDLGDLGSASRACQHAAATLTTLEDYANAATIVGTLGLTPMSPSEADRFNDTDTQLKSALGNDYATTGPTRTDLQTSELVDLTLAALEPHVETQDPGSTASPPTGWHQRR